MINWLLKSSESWSVRDWDMDPAGILRVIYFGSFGCLSGVFGDLF